jgi:hypothetical protein
VSRPYSEGRKRSTHISLRVTEAELAELRAGAEREGSGGNVSGWLVEVGLARARRPAEEPQAIVALRTALCDAEDAHERIEAAIDAIADAREVPAVAPAAKR